MAENGVQSFVLSVLMLSEVDQICCDVICIIIVISILRCVQTVSSDLLISFKISKKSLIQLFQSILLILEYKLLNCRHGICVGGKS